MEQHDHKHTHEHGSPHVAEEISATLAQSAHFELLANLFKLLDDYSRLRIFWLLCHTEECVTNISLLVDMTAPAVSHHLKLLKANNLIVSRRDGKEVYYKVPDTPLCNLLHKGIEMMMEISCPE